VSRSNGVGARACLALVLGLGSLATGSGAPVWAADEPEDQPLQLLQAAGETRTVPDQTGTLVRAVVDGWDLDQYLFRDSSPLDFAIDVDDDFGPVDGAGHPAPGNALHGLTGRISLRVFDVDDDAPTAPEVDHVYVNGMLLGTLSGAHDQWSINTFEFPLEHLLLPTATNPDGQNEFQVDIDTTNTGWAVRVDWAELRLNEDFVPLGLVTGWERGNGMADFRNYFINESSLEGDEIVAPLHSTTNLESGAEEINTEITELLITSGAHHLNVIGHSYGGLVSRLYAWDNPSRVNKLIMIGTPNGGSELADAACLGIDAGPFGFGIWAAQLFDDQFGPCGGPDDALFQLQTDYVRNVFNAQVRDRTGTEYWTISGVLPDEGRLFDFFPGADDGWVTLNSSQYLLIGRPDHPGKHRLLGTIPFEHGAMINLGSDAMPLAVCELYDEGCDVQGALMQSQVVADPSDLVIREFDGVQVAPSSSGTVDLAFEGADTASVVLISDQLDTIAATLPGATFHPARFMETDVLVAKHASPSDAQLQITNTGNETAGVVAIVGVPAGRSLEVDPAESLLQPNASTDLTISLSEAGNNELVVAEVTAPSGAVAAVSLTETTLGSWTGVVTPTESGVHTVTAWVEGSRSRFDSTLFTVSTGQAQLTGAFSERLEGADDGLADALVIAPELTVSAAGRYRLTADLADVTGAVIGSAGAVADVAQGTSGLDLEFEGRAIFEAGIDGPFRIVNVVLSRDDAGLTLEDQIGELGSTASYDHRAFDHFPILFDRASFVDSGVDADSDAIFESLQVDFSVNVEVAGTYALNARLLAPDGTEVAEAQSTPSLTIGANELVLRFDAESIAAAGLDGPYTVADLSLYPLTNADQLGYLVTAHTTAAYTAAQFGAASPVVASDAFERSMAGGWGEADVGGPYTVTAASDFAVAGGVGTITPSTVNGFKSARLLSVAAQDFDLTVRVSTDRLAAGGDQNAYVEVRHLDTTNAYRLRVGFEPDADVVLQWHKVAAGVTSTLAAEAEVAGLTHAANAWFNLRVQAEGSDPTSLRAKVWAAGTGEPAGWTLTASDSEPALQQSLAVGLRALLGNGASVGPVFRFDDLSVRVLEGTPAADFTVSTTTGSAPLTAFFDDTSAGGPTSWAWDFGDGTTDTGPNPTHTYAAPGTYTVALTVTNANGSDTEMKAGYVVVDDDDAYLARDRFERTESGGWGSADLGGAYTASTPADSSVAAGEGILSPSSLNALRAARLLGVDAGDVEVLVRVDTDKLAAGNSQSAYLELRHPGANDGYRLRLSLEPDGSVLLWWQKVVSGTASSVSGLHTVTREQRVSADDAFWIRAQAEGASPTSLRARAWQDGTPEPIGWDVEGSDSSASLQAPNAIGLRALLGSGTTNAPVQVRFDELSATELVGGQGLMAQSAGSDPDAEGLLLDALSAKVASRCVEYGEGAVLPSDWQARADAIAARRTPTGWLASGTAWVGDLASATSAFGGTRVAERDGHAWLLRKSGSTWFGSELRQELTMRGTSVWVVDDPVHVLPATECH
jgi:PKD repeat protein/pimeloyl-ACP methyl ester carboxylesterase